MDPGSITDQLPQLRTGDPDAIRQVWEHYFGPLVELARRKIKGLPGWSTDGEDVALSAFKSFCRAVGNDQFPKLEDRDDLWQVLVVILGRKACDHARHANAARRGGRAAHQPADEQLQAAGPSPHEEAALADELRALLEVLDEEALQNVALLKLAGHTNAEVAEKLACGVRTVERKLERIRRIWDEKGAGA